MTSRPTRATPGRHPLRASAAAVALACCAGTTACTGSDPHPAPPTQPVRVHSAAATSPGAEAGTKTAAAGGCRIVSATTVARRFGGRVVSQSTGSTPLGHPMCTFVMQAPRLGGSGIVSAVETARSSAAAFTHARTATQGARAVDGVGDRAFYVSATGTVTFLAGRTLVLVHAQFRAPGGHARHGARLRENLVALSRSIASTL